MSAPTNMPWCPRCSKHYPAGDKTGHCGNCHKTFYGLAAYGHHRRGPHGPERQCINPGIDEKLDWWRDDRQRWHLGQKLTAEESRKIWGKHEPPRKKKPRQEHEPRWGITRPATKARSSYQSNRILRRNTGRIRLQRESRLCSWPPRWHRQAGLSPSPTCGGSACPNLRSRSSGAALWPPSNTIGSLSTSAGRQAPPPPARNAA